MSNIRLVFSPLSGQFYAGKMRKKGNILISSGNKTNVTNDFMDCMINYLFKSVVDDDKNTKKIETIITAHEDGSKKKYKILVEDIT